MSSAAVQQSQSPPGHDRYSINPAAKLSSSPPSSRRAGKQSVNGSAPNTPQQAQYASPSTTTSSMMPGGRTQQAASSPLDPTFASSRGQFYPDPSSSTALPANALPIRTSSQQPSHQSYDDRTAYGSRAAQAPSAGYGSESDRDQRGSTTHRTQRDDPQGSSSRSQRTRPAPTSSRSANAIESSLLPRENSAIINHIVVDDPQSDIARERARLAEARPNQVGTGIAITSDQTPPEPQSAPRSRQEHLKHQSNTPRKEVRFGDYILGQTLGEGEFGKVKMGWKKDSSVQVAIKLIRKESLAGNTTRLPKIYREIAILRELQHPNIVRLHEFVETERHMGIILEYASGGELFDYILNHRYLKDPAARRLFAQLVSGVGYLHKKGIVHRDLKLENLLLDRNRNIIITDFGFANTFNPNDELGEGIEHRITDKEFVKSSGLDAVGSDGHRRGDLMQTSCGSPCYAAPELVVSDGLYTGRKVDVWSCGVILYAMLAGYLPFDDDPANPEGDNINLLYKYIVSTPLTFPEYVTPHARDLLRRILVPEPRRRADLFEVARHSWLSEYSHVVGFIGSSTKSDRDIASSALHQEEEPTLGRSASVREPSSRSQTHMNAKTGSYAKPNNPIVTEEELRNQQRDAKRRTVQVEYVAPKGSTTRAPAIVSNVAAAPARTRARDSQSGPIEVPQNAVRQQHIPRKDLPGSAMPPPVSRQTRDQVRSASDSNAFTSQPTTSISRPTTGGTLGGNPRLPSRGNSYSQPVAAATTTNVQGHFSQPKSGTGYIISGPPDQVGGELPRPSTQQNLGQFPATNSQQQQQLPRSHKRSSTLGSLGDRLLGRSNSKRASQHQDTMAAQNEKRDRRYPPVSMKNSVSAPGPPVNDEPQPRMSSESRRPSFSFSRRQPSEANSEKRQSRRFSFLPGSFSISNFTGKKDASYESDGRAGSSYGRAGRPASKGMPLPHGQSPSGSQSTLDSAARLQYGERSQRQVSNQSRDPRFDKALPPQPGKPDPPPGNIQRKQFRDDGYGENLLEVEPPERFYTPGEASSPRLMSALPDQYNTSVGRAGPSATYANDGYDFDDEPIEPSRQGVPQIRAPGRKFENAYDQGHAGSSSGARRVMDFFRRRGRERSAS